MPRALTWLREHWRPVAVLTGLLLAFGAGWAAHRPAPRIEYRDRVAVQQQTAEHHQEQLATTAQQTSASTATEQLHATRHVTTHRTEHVLPSGERTVETTRTEGDELELAEAQQVNVVVTFGQVLRVDETSSSSSTATRETSLVQTPAPLLRYRLAGLAGLSTHGVVYGGEASVRLLGPLWLGAWGLTAPAGGVSLAVEW